jgi:hypothetical protein
MPSFSLQKKLVVKKSSNLYLGLVMPSSGLYKPIDETTFSCKDLQVAALDTTY